MEWRQCILNGNNKQRENQQFEANKCQRLFPDFMEKVLYVNGKRPDEERDRARDDPSHVPEEICHDVGHFFDVEQRVNKSKDNAVQRRYLKGRQSLPEKYVCKAFQDEERYPFSCLRRGFAAVVRILWRCVRVGSRGVGVSLLDAHVEV